MSSKLRKLTPHADASFPSYGQNPHQSFFLCSEPVAQTSRAIFLVTSTYRGGFSSRRFLAETVRSETWTPGGSAPSVPPVLWPQILRSVSPVLTRPARLATAPEFQQIVRRAEELPLTRTGLFASSQEPVTAQPHLDLPKDRFDRLPPCFVQATPRLREQRSVHPLPSRQVFGYPPSRRGLFPSRSGGGNPRAIAA